MLNALALAATLPLTAGDPPDFFALDIASAGDWNGDGVSDLVVEDGAWWRDEGESCLWVLSGKDGAVLERLEGPRDEVAGWLPVGPLRRRGERRFLAVHGGAAVEELVERRGSALVVLRGPGPRPRAVDVLPGTEGDDDVLLVDVREGARVVRLSGAGEGPVWDHCLSGEPVECGLAVPEGLDLDRDGARDVVVAFADVERAAGARPRDCCVRVLSGASGELLASYTVALAWSSGHCAPRLVPLGDIDGDGHPDMAVDPGHLFFFDGRPGPQLVGFDVANGWELFRVWSGNPQSVASIGDVNCDGLPDLALAGLRDDVVEVRSGADGGVVYEASGPAEAGYFGTDVAGLGDVDGDGVPDYAVADKEAGAPDWPGLVAVMSGKDGEVLYVRRRSDVLEDAGR